MRRTAASLFVLGALVTAGGASAQSFNCKSPHYADEQVICRDANLSKLDDQLARAFGETMNQLTPRERKELADDEEDWVVARRQCGGDSRCIAEEYRTRIRELTGVMPSPAGSHPTPPVVAVGPRDPAEQPPQTSQARPEPAQAKPQPPAISERQPQRAVEQPPFPIVERPPQALLDRLPILPVERPPQAVVERPSQPQAERPPQAIIVNKQTLPTVAEQPVDPERQAGTTEQQPNPAARPPSTAERKQPSANSSTAKEERQERRSSGHEARKITETSQLPDSGTPERDAEVAKTTPKTPQHKAKLHRTTHTVTNRADVATAASATSAVSNPPRTASIVPPPAAGAGTPTKPSIQWIDPPPR